MIRELFRSVWPAILLAATAIAGAQAQGQPPTVWSGQSSQSQICARLESQLAALDRSAADSGRADQLRRYEDGYSRQRFELDRMVSQARRSGCEGSGFFLFGGGQPPQCDQVNNQIQRMRTNLDRMMMDLQRLQGSGGDVEGQRRAIQLALSQYNCGPQYRSAAPAGPRSLWESLFGGESVEQGNVQGSNFRTVCVRTCDGFYFPVSYSTSSGRFRDDEKVCQRMCPAAEVMLFTYRNPGEDIAQAVSVSGKPYTELPNAFRYRQEFNSACSCKKVDESWAEALKTVDDPVERGDIIITDEKSRTLSQPRAETPRVAKQSGRKADSKPPASSPEIVASPLPDAVAPPLAPAEAPPETGKRTVRTVGPKFLPTR